MRCIAIMSAFEHILVPIDFEPQSREALAVAMDLSRKLGSKITLMHAYELPAYAYTGMAFTGVDLLGPVEDEARKMLEHELARAKEKLPADRVDAVLRRGVAWQEILAAAKEARCDLVVMGTHGRHGLPRALLGSVAERVVRLSPIAVLTVRTPEPATTSPLEPG